jgi:hypothetical protein
MNILEFNPQWKKDIAFCFVDNTRQNLSPIRELIKNQADGCLVNIYNKGYTVFQWIDEDALLRHATTKGYKFAVVLSTGTEFLNGSAFFDSLENLVTTNFFIAGHVLDRKDAYYELHHQCYVVNLDIYNELGQPVVGKQELGAQHKQFMPNRSDENWHDDYTPKVVTSGDQVKEYYHKCHGWNILKTAFDKNLPVVVFDDSIRNNKMYFYPESPQDFNKQLSWAYYRLNYCQSQFVHKNNTETINVPVKKYKQIVTPASGTWFVDYATVGSSVIFYDYNEKSLEYWSNNVPALEGVSYKFVLCDLLGNDDLVEHLDAVEDTLVHLSNIFNYEATVFFYSVDYREYKEKELLEKLKKKIPTAEIFFNLRAKPFSTIPSWHLS